MNALLSAHGITKRFPGVTALRDVSFDLRPGEIHALCGENGAGKSTLIKLLSGLHPHGTYEGELHVSGEPAHFRSIADAQAAGLAVIYQELALVEEMTVAENIFLGSEPRRGLLIDWHRVYRDARELLARFKVDLDPAARCGDLGVGQRQLVEIVKALAKDSRILILDEPTAALAEHEVQTLLTILRDLRARGLACIYISHKLEEVFALADRITVLRDGATIITSDAGDITKDEIIRHMVGRDIGELFPPRPSAPAPPEFGAFLRELIAHPGRTLTLFTRDEQIILNADALVDISPEYVGLPLDEQRVLHPRLHPLARQARDRAFDLLLSRAPREGEVLHFMAGGQASGKSTIIRGLEGLIFDSMLADAASAKAMIDRALASGREVAVRYVHRPFAEAVAANIQRYFDTGRAPSVPRMAECHAAARSTFESLRTAFAGARAVSFHIFLNLPPAPQRIAAHSFFAEFPRSSVDAFTTEGNAIVDEHLATGRIDRILHDALKSSTGESGARHGQGPRLREGKNLRGAGEGRAAARIDPGAVAALRVAGLSVADPQTGTLRLRDISFSLARGEVLGIGGLMGAGRTELLMHLFGAWGVRRGGRVELDGAELPVLPPAEVLRRGIALVSEDRRRYGLILEHSIGFNLSLSSLGRLTRGGLIDAPREFQQNDARFRALRIKAPSLEAATGKLSGGNQQKVVLGKALQTEPRVIFLDEPTRGIDVGAKREIYEIINTLTAEGCAIVLVSSELPELLGMSDRILMLHEGRVGGLFSRAEATPEGLLAAAMGSQVADRS